ncbi:MAG: hypothetical protein CL676_07310, partial [Bdellovibrionaceae bacterium]|nr:hypothetical protein [Pseudobdellovibrionaceae bacterium]
KDPISSLFMLILTPLREDPNYQYFLSVGHFDAPPNHNYLRRTSEPSHFLPDFVPALAPTHIPYSRFFASVPVLAFVAELFLVPALCSSLPQWLLAKRYLLPFPICTAYRKRKQVPFGESFGGDEGLRQFTR